MIENKTKIDEYEIIKMLSEGSTSFVYLAKRAETEYALKLLKTSGADTVTRFRRESAALARLKHENLVKIFDVGEYAYRFSSMKMDSIEGKYYLKHEDSLRRVKGDGLPKLPIL